MHKARSADDVCQDYAEKGVQLTIRKLDANNILIEGDPTSLRFLGDLITAHAASQGDDGFQISPKGAGRAHFDPAATLGLYLHRLPAKKS